MEDAIPVALNRWRDEGNGVLSFAGSWGVNVEVLLAELGSHVTPGCLLGMGGGCHFSLLMILKPDT